MPVENDGDDVQTKLPSETGGGPSSPTKPNAKPNEGNTYQLEKDIKRGEWWLIRIGIATLLINTVIAVIYWGQLQEMRKATKATQDAVDVASRTLTETQASNARQAILSDLARKSSEEGAQKSLQATIDEFNQDQRAWIGLTGFKIEKDLTIPNSVSNDSAIAGFYNSGHTPAKNVRALIGLGFEMNDYVLGSADRKWFDSFINDIRTNRAKPDPQGWGRGNLRTSYRRWSPTLHFEMIVESISLGDIAPGVTAPYKHLMTWKASTQVHEFLFGALSYDDVSNNQRRTEFCVYRPQREDDRLSVCPIFNEMK